MSEPGTTDPLSLVGTTIADKYAVEGVVGQGGFAIVYRAMHVLWKRPVAVKVFKALGEVAESQREKLLADFIQEGALLADLSERSTAICQARDVGMLTTPKGEHVPYMVLEWLEGKSLDAVLEDERARGAPLRTLAEAARLLEPVAQALALAHKKGIAHRDVKPANVFILGDPRAEPVAVKLLDFGIAKVVQDAQKMGFGKTAGHITSFTPLYGAPEQFNRAHGATGPWTDVFALALVVAEVASGREPMSGDSLVQLAYASADPQHRPTPRALGVATSDEVEAVFQRAVAIEPDKRWQTVGEFWSALCAAVFGVSSSSRISGSFVDSASSSRSSRAAASGPLATAATALPDAVGATVLDPGAPPSAAHTGGGALASASTLSPDTAPKRSPAPYVIAAAGVLAVVGVVGGAFAWKGARHASASAPSASVAPKVDPSASSSVVAAAASCPPGMVYVPGGEYFMGSEKTDGPHEEGPPHKVKLSAYCLDAYEVTTAKYKQCSDAGKCRRAGEENVWPGIKPAQRKIYDPLCNVLDLKARANHPINCVDWQQAREYCEAQGGRLPTEAEWELAARGPDGRIYPWGDEAPSADLLNACGTECVAWMKKHPDPDNPPAAMYDADDGFATTSPVGSFPKGNSRYGLYDIVGNVWEWVADWYADYGAGSATSVATDPKGPAAGKRRVLRGGAWNGALPSWVRPSLRFSAAPESRSYAFGFRCAKSL